MSCQIYAYRYTVKPQSPATGRFSGVIHSSSSDALVLKKIAALHNLTKQPNGNYLTLGGNEVTIAATKVVF